MPIRKLTVFDDCEPLLSPKMVFDIDLRIEGNGRVNDGFRCSRLWLLVTECRRLWQRGLIIVTIHIYAMIITYLLSLPFDESLSLLNCGWAINTVKQCETHVSA